MRKDLLIIAALSLGGQNALAGGPMPTPSLISAEGECARPGAIKTGMTTLPDGLVAFGIDFQGRSFQAIDQVDDGERVSAHCDLRVAVALPQGYRLRIERFALDGYIRAQGDDLGYVSASYYAMHHGDHDRQDAFVDFNMGIDPEYPAADSLAQDDRLLPTSVLGVSQGPWAARYMWGGGDDAVSACGETVELASEIWLHAAKVGAAGGVANMALFKNDQAGRVEWGWRLERCEAWFQGPWRSRYSVNGGWVAAGLNFFSEQNGQYTTSSWTGDLQVERYDEREVTGTWLAQGESGWFHFEKDADGDHFHGSWGRQPGHPQGSWSGER